MRILVWDVDALARGSFSVAVAVAVAVAVDGQHSSYVGANSAALKVAPGRHALEFASTRNDGMAGTLRVAIAVETDEVKEIRIPSLAI